ncbi:hypothetical protein [Streptomyces sp. NPDC059928]|uniref:hypothetical protein n=1 Tax=unclassified Streptomyces TaxID=2593676 RepID=UPI00364A2E41
MARAKKVEVPAFDRDVWEYLTYAPGQQCSTCKRKVKSLEPVLRRSVDRTSGAPSVVYRHNVCPSAESVAA